ncbi:8625_t:CDS:2, partial [Racocetra persica]
SVVQKRRKVSDKNIEKVIIKKFKQNDYTYTPEFGSLTTTLSTTAQIFVHDNLPQFSSRFSSYGILADKNLDQHLALTVSLSVGEAIIKNSLNLTQYQYWLTDNTAYISGLKGGA